MKNRFVIAGLAAVLLALSAVPDADAGWGYRRYGYGGYGGYRGGYYGHYNSWNGGLYRGGSSGYNAYTGRYGGSRSFYNPYTGRYGDVQGAYNPYTNRYGYHYSYGNTW